MLQAKTHFQQLPVEAAKKIAAQEEAEAALAVPVAKPARPLALRNANTKDSRRVS